MRLRVPAHHTRNVGAQDGGEVAELRVTGGFSSPTRRGEDKLRTRQQDEQRRLLISEKPQITSASTPEPADSLLVSPWSRRPGSA
jgi:hypothetical protein